MKEALKGLNNFQDKIQCGSGRAWKWTSLNGSVPIKWVDTTGRDKPKFQWARCIRIAREVY